MSPRPPGQRKSPGPEPAFRSRIGSVPDAAKEAKVLARAGSYRGRRRYPQEEARKDVWPEADAVNVAEQRFLQLPDAEDYTRLRTFSIRPDGGVVSRGDSFRRRLSTKGSQGSSESHASATPHLPSSEVDPWPSRCSVGLPIGCSGAGEPERVLWRGRGRGVPGRGGRGGGDPQVRGHAHGRGGDGQDEPHQPVHDLRQPQSLLPRSR